ncbi:uncharacterized protein SPSC_02123 [Sporisorium scitamineum]|uniref:Homeobox domain-containing protein n=2 Tax=Sporisorium scitamineum TaxID=49012 RepID=A0A127ZBN2_9BASI|nr:uncharacterized protein SPSC_02123 [Sporisorium scitamineum]
MLLCDDDEEEVWSNSSEGHTKRISDKDAANDAAAGSTTHADIGNGRSRRLLSLEQSKVLYKILDKTHFPSTQLREAAASQLGVSPRKVQVWFQNRRQVGKKRMMEAVSSIISTHPPSTPISLDALQEQLQSTLSPKGAGGCVEEDERTRAWRRHTIRLALNPGEQEEEECRAAIRELERGSRDSFALHHQQQRERERYVQTASYGGEMAFGSAERSRIRTARSAASLRISVPHTNASSHTSPFPDNISTPTYTGPGSATHLETLSARTPRTCSALMPPLTPAAVRSAIVPPAIVTSQKESFSLPPGYPAQHQRVRVGVEKDYLQQMQGQRVRSATLAVSQPRWEEMKGVRGSMTAEWSAEQRAYQRARVSPPYTIATSKYSPTEARGVRYRSSTDARLPPLLPSLHANSTTVRRDREIQRERYTPYPSRTYPPPQQGYGVMLRPPPPSAAAGGAGGVSMAGRSRSISTPIHRSLELNPNSHPHAHAPNVGIRRITSPPDFTLRRREQPSTVASGAGGNTPPHRERFASPRKLSPPTPLRLRASTTNPTLSPSSHRPPQQQRSSDSCDSTRESRSSVLMDVRTLTNRS